MVAIGLDRGGIVSKTPRWRCQPQTWRLTVPLCVHLAYPLRLRKRLRSTNLLERSLEEVRHRTKVIGRFPGETSCLH